MILIAGAGIGGLTLGCALARAGISFRIVDRAPDLRPAGAGITLADNAFRALAHIGLDARVRACGAPLGVAAIQRPSGRPITAIDTREAGLGSSVAMSRTRLQQALLESLGQDVELGRDVESYEPDRGSVRVRLADGGVALGTLLIGADGLHSRVRRAMLGDTPLRYSGQTSWRAIVRAPFVNRDRVTETWGASRRFGVVPIGGDEVYWFAVADAPAGGRDGHDVRDVLARMFSGWHAPVEALIAATDPTAILRTDIADRAPVDRWTDGRVALLGDAAHPMTPNLGMGGCQAIEDAVVLADAIAREGERPAALARYQARRLTRANGFVERSRRLGQLAHVRPAALRWIRDGALSCVPRGLAVRALARDLDFRM